MLLGSSEAALQKVNCEAVVKIEEEKKGSTPKAGSVIEIQSPVDSHWIAQSGTFYAKESIQYKAMSRKHAINIGSTN